MASNPTDPELYIGAKIEGAAWAQLPDLENEYLQNTLDTWEKIEELYEVENP